MIEKFDDLSSSVLKDSKIHGRSSNMMKSGQRHVARRNVTRHTKVVLPEYFGPAASRSPLDITVQERR